MAEEKSGEIRQGGGDKKVAAGAAEPKEPERHMIPVWFFVGLLLSVYGILIFIKGIAEWAHPPHTTISSANPFHVTLAHLHPAFWWGALLIVMGGIFVFRTWPGKKHDDGGKD